MSCLVGLKQIIGFSSYAHLGQPLDAILVYAF